MEESGGEERGRGRRGVLKIVIRTRRKVLIILNACEGLFIWLIGCYGMRAFLGACKKTGGFSKV